MGANTCPQTKLRLETIFPLAGSFCTLVTQSLPPLTARDKERQLNYARTLLLTAISVAAMFGSVAPAMAVSNISNSIYIEDSVPWSALTTGDQKQGNSRSTFGSTYIWNPYPSNFVTEIATQHFRRPHTLASYAVRNSSKWTWHAQGLKDPFPVWRQASRSQWILPAKKSSLFYIMESQPNDKATKNTWRRNWHGQSRALDWGVSWGPDAEKWTKHN